MKISAMLFLLISTSVSAADKDPRHLARKLYLSLTGVSPTSQELDIIQDKVAAQNAKGAALDIIDQKNGIKNNGAFYNVTVKDMVTPWTSKSKTTLAPLNDMSATIIGWVRDDNKPFNKILYANSVYKAMGVTFKGELTIKAKAAADSDPFCIRDLTQAEKDNTTLYRIVHNNPKKPNDANDKACRLTKFRKTSATAPNEDENNLDYFSTVNALYLPHLDLVIKSNLIISSNEHYESISNQGLDLGDANLLVDSSQDSKLHAYPAAISGLFSTRAFGEAYLFAGTNRAPVAFAMEHFLCKDMESLNDTTIPDFRNRRDVDRSPGGTSEIYKNRCIGCHAGMDALSGAFAYYEWTAGKVIYSPGKVSTKMNHNVNFAEGFVTQSDSWMNLWTQGQNAALKWGSSTAGEGVKSLGMMLSETEAFHSCMSKQVYEKVCNRKATSDQDKMRVASLTESYKASNFSMKKLFINASVECMGD